MAGNELLTFETGSIRAGDDLVFRGQTRTVQAIKTADDGTTVLAVGFGDELTLHPGDKYEGPARPAAPAVESEVEANSEQHEPLPEKAEEDVLDMQAQ